MNKRSLLLWLLLLASFAALMTFTSRTPDAKKEKNVTISEFVALVQQGEMQEVSIAGAVVTGVTKDKTIVHTYCANNDKLIEELYAHKVQFSEVEPAGSNQWLSLALKLILPLVLIFVFFKMMNGAANGQMKKMDKFTSTKAALKADEVKTKFSDVAGIDEAVEDIRDLVVYLREPKRFSRVGGRMPKGVLLMGPPGTGKTLLAKALAGEAQVPFFSMAESNFVEMFVGVGASRVRDLFEQAKKQAPCIVFIDEIDGVGRHRGGGNGNSHDEREQTLNEMLRQMDGFTDNAGIIVIAATNRPDILDDALTRSGRFDRHVIVPAPDVGGRESILKVHARGKAVGKDIDWRRVARMTPGMVGADLEKLVNEAAVAASKANRSTLDMTDIESAIEKVYLGPTRKGMRLTRDELRIIAVHESGHAIVGHFSPGCDPVRKVTCVPRGQALGVTLLLPDEDRHLESQPELLDRIKMGLGGRAAEELAIGQVTGGCSGDLEMVTSTIQKMIAKYGMSQSVGLRTIGNRNRQAHWEATAGDRDFSEATAQLIDAEIKKISDDSYAQVKALLTEKRELLDRMAQLLIEKETLDEADMLALLGPRPKA